MGRADRGPQPWGPCLGCPRVPSLEESAPSRLLPDMLPEAEAGSPWLLRLLRGLQLAQFHRPILEELNVTRPEHFDFVRPQDLDAIGMGRPGEAPARGPLSPKLPPSHTSPLLPLHSWHNPPPPYYQPFNSGLPQPSADWLKL